ncbi:MAG: hypothetical protein R3E53_01805 [Myxococcota bacterium]
MQKNAIQLFGGIGVTASRTRASSSSGCACCRELFGDADWHVARFQGLKRFDAID